MIQIQDVYFSYQDGPILGGIDLTINKGEYVGIMGESGSGKTTLAKLIIGLLLPQNGVIKINGISTQESTKLLEIRKAVGLVFQNPDTQIIGETVEEDLVFGLENLQLSVTKIDDRIDRYLGLLGINHLRYSNFRLLSCGQKQLVNLAAVMAMQQHCIIFDEPVSMVDRTHQKKILAFIHELNRSGVAVIHITHDPGELVHCSRIIIISNGRVAYQGTPYEVFEHMIRNDEHNVPVTFAISRKLGLAPVSNPEELVKKIWLSRSKT
jgi:energy-coupling factor transport system ATP-binding protein